MKRIGIFFFYDPQGIVDRYVDVMLEAFKPFIEKLVVVVNGKLNRNGRLLFKKYTDDVLVRQNTEFDIGAYKYALEYIGWEEIYKYDELVMFNHTIFAPIFPLNEMFEAMEKQDDVDFWGITQTHQFDGVPQRLKSHLTTSFIPEHINSHFIAVRGEMLSDLALREHFDKMPEIKTHEDSNFFHEILFTQKFSNSGYHWTVYAESDFLKKSITYPLLEAPLEMLNKTRCPILKRKNFFGNFESYLHKNAANDAVRLLDYLKEQTVYDTNLIYENMIRTCSMGELQQFFPLRHIISEKSAPNIEVKIGIIVSVGSHNILNKYTDTLQSFSTFLNAKVFLVVDNDVAEIISREIETCGFTISKILRYDSDNPKESDDNLIASVLKKYTDEFDYFCIIGYTLPYVHKQLISEESVVYVNNANLIGSENHVNGIINTFSENEWLGVLVPPVPLLADYTRFVGNKAVDFIPQLKTIANSLELIFSEQTAFAIFGSLWIKSKALKSLTNFLGEVTDINLFEQRPLSSLFGSALSLYAQADGYFTGIVYSKEYAETELKVANYFINKLQANVAPAMHLFGVVDRINDLKKKVNSK